jgi:hypothetical protein
VSRPSAWLSSLVRMTAFSATISRRDYEALLRVDLTRSPTGIRTAAIGLFTPAAVRPGEGRFTEATPAVPPWRREPSKMPP